MLSIVFRSQPQLLSLIRRLSWALRSWKLLCGPAVGRQEGEVARWVRAGITLFSGSIYAYVLSGHKAFQFLTPFGGLSFMAGWGTLTLYHGRAAIQTGAA